MKTLSAGLLAHYAGSTTTIATCWKVTRRDATVFGFTDLDRDIVFDSVTYVAETGFTRSSVITNNRLALDNLELNGLLDSAGITLQDVEAGLWDGAEFEIFEVNYEDLTQGRNILETGWIARVRQDSKGIYVAELHGLTSKLQQTVGRVVIPSCDAILGDARCGVDLTPFTETDVPVTTVTSRLVLTATSLIGSPDTPGFYDFGVLTFTTGANAGLTREIKSHATGGILTLQDAFPFTVQVADEFTIVAGCNKRHKLADGSYNGDCKAKFDNVVNFRGFPEVPMMNEAMRGGR